MLKLVDDTEERYFRIFQYETAAELEGWFESSFWKRLILQACVEEPFTQKVVTALISRLSTSKKRSYNIEMDTAHRAIVAQQAEFAYKQYQKALLGARKALKNDGDNRKALMGCILVCCFESHVGDTAREYQHGMAYSLFMRLELLRSCHNPLVLYLRSRDAVEPLILFTLPNHL
jgi:hypothetical protein